MADRSSAGRDRYLPFNLSSVLPFEANAAALQALPSVHPRPPAGHSVLSDFEVSEAPPDETRALMLDILTETAQEGEWPLGEEAGADAEDGLSEDCPEWVSELANALPQVVPKKESSRSRRLKRPRVQESPSPERAQRRRQSTAARESTLRPMADLSPSRETQPPLDDGADAMEEEEERRERIVQEAEALADKETIRRFVTTLEAFVDRVDSYAARREGDIAAARLQVTSNAKYMNELLCNVQVHAQMGIVALVPGDVLRSVVDALVARVRSETESAGIVMQSPASPAELSGSELGIRCACIVLTLLSAPNIPRTLLLQDTLDECLRLLRTTSMHIIYPACDGLYPIPGLPSSKRKGKAVASASGDEESGEDDDGGRNSASAAKDSRVKAAAKRKIDGLLQLSCLLYDCFAVLLGRETGLAESFVSQVLSLALNSLGVEGIASLQIAAGRLTESVAASYPDQDATIVDGLREHLSKLPANRRSLRNYHIDGKAKSVRVATALLVKVLNVVGGRSNEKMIGAKGCTSPDELRKQVTCLAFRLVDGMLTRTFADRDPEYRAALSAVFTDVLELFSLPEWPSAEILTQTFGLRLVITLNKGSAVSVQSRVICLDMLGQLAARACSLYGATALLFPGNAHESLWTDEEYREQVKKERVGLLSFLNDCAKTDVSCRYAQLFDCAQFALDDADACESFHKARHATLQSEDDEKPPEIPKEQLLKLRREAMDASSRALTDLFRSTRGPYDGHRTEAVSSALYVSQRRLFIRQLPKIIDTIREGLRQPEPTLRTKAIKTLSVIADSEPAVLTCVPALLLAIEASCMDVSKSVREAALDLLSRAVSSLETPDQALEGVKVVSTGMGKSPDTPGSSTYGAEFFEKVFPIVQKRLLDSATSVRKRGIAIMRGVLVDAMAQASRHRDGSREKLGRLDRLIGRVCYTLSDRVDDREDSVRESAERALRLALFGFDHSALGSVPSEAQDEASAGVFASRLVSIYVAVINNAKSTTTQRNLIGHVLHDAIIVKRRRLVNLICGDVVEILHGAESLLAGKTALFVDKERPLSGDDEVLLRREIEVIHRKRLACSSVLEAFAKVEASLVVAHCQALTPYVKGVVEAKRRHPAEIMHVTRVLSILEICVPVAGRSFSAERLEEVIGDVEKIVCMCPSAAIAQPAIKCFCVLARHSSNPEMVSMPTQTSQVFFDFLHGARDELASAHAHSNSESIRNARQALPRLGLLARYGDFDDEYISAIYEVLQFLCGGMIRDWIRGSREAGPTHEEATASADKGNVSGNKAEPARPVFNLRVGSIRSLLYFLARHRAYLPRATDILVVCLRQGRGDVDFDAQMTVLSGIQEMLVEEEARNVSASEKIGKKLERAAPGAKGDVVLAAEEDVEAGFLAICAQAVVPELNRTARSNNAEVRKAVVTSLGLLARQGLVLPAKIVPALFGLLVDGNLPCREGAHHVVGFLAERYPGMLSSAALGAVRHTFSPAMLTRTLSPSDSILDHVCGSAVDPVSGYALLSAALVQIQRDQRRGILCGVVKEFDPRVKTVSLGPESRSDRVRDGEAAVPCMVTPDRRVRDDDDVGVSGDVSLVGAGIASSLPNLAFYAVTLATMDYAAGSGVGGSFTVGGGTAVADGKLKAAREDVLEVTSVISRILSNSGQAVLEAAAQIPSYQGEELDELKAKIACHCAPLCMLLLVKRFLRQTRWNLTPAERDEEENGGDSAMVPAPTFDLSSIPFVYSSASDGSLSLGGTWSFEDPDALLQVFRNLMRNDSIDEAEPVTGSGRRKSGSSRRKSITPKRPPKGTPNSGAQRTPKRTPKPTRRKPPKKIGSESDDSDDSYQP